MAYEDLMVTKIGYQQLDNTLACSKLQDSGESKSKNKREKPREDWEERVSRRFARLHILGDPGAVSRVGRKGGTKVSKYGRKSPWVPTLTELFPKIQADAASWLGTKNALYYCAQSANSFSWVLFVSSYTTAIVSITACRAHAAEKCTQSGNFQFDKKSPSDFKILAARKLKTLFQKYKPELTPRDKSVTFH